MVAATRYIAGHRPRAPLRKTSGAKNDRVTGACPSGWPGQASGNVHRLGRTKRSKRVSDDDYVTRAAASILDKGSDDQRSAPGVQCTRSYEPRATIAIEHQVVSEKVMYIGAITT